MAHPFFDETVNKYPWYRPEARRLHEVLYSVFTDPAIIKRTYYASAKNLNPLPWNAAPDVIWTEALEKLTTRTGALRSFCEQNQESTNAELREAIRRVMAAKPEHLSRGQVAALKEAFTTAGKSYDAEARREFLKKLPEAYIDQLPKEDNDVAQLTSDVDQLNTTTDQFEQQLPLKIWLQNAHDYFKGFSEALVFKQTLEDLSTHPSQRTDADKIAKVIEKVWLKIQADKTAREAVGYYKRIFHRARQGIGVITDFKGLHEEIHTLQMSWRDNIDDEIKGLPSDPKAKLNVRKHTWLLTTIVQKMNKIIENGNVKPDKLESWCHDFGGEVENGRNGHPGKRNWLEALRKFEGEFSEAVNGNEKKKISEIFGNVINCLSPTLSGLSKQLKEGVDELNLKELICAMGEVCNVLIKLEPQRTAEKVSLYQAGINEMKALDEHLRALKDQHDRWQAADIKLKMFNDLLKLSIIEGRETGPVLELFLIALPNDFEPLYRESAADWAREVKSAATEIRASLGKKDNNKAEQWFQHYCEHMAYRFYELDAEMKAQCDELSKVGDKLQKVDDELENM